MARRTKNGAQEAAYNLEHWLAWLMAVIALVLVTIGLLVGFGILGTEEGRIVFREEALEPGAEQPAAAEVEQAGGFVGNFGDGMLFLLPALIAGILAFTLHMNDHHRTPEVRALIGGEESRRESRGMTAEKGLWGIEHGAAYVMALAAIGLGIVGILVGFDVFNNNNTQTDGVLWLFAGVAVAAVTATLHAVRHHSTVMEEDYIVRLVEDRVGGTAPARRPATGETIVERGPSETA